MGMTMTQKILAAHAGLDRVSAGQLIQARFDLVLGNDVTAPVAINEFEKAGMNNVFDRDKIALVMDHFTPNKDIKAAEQCKIVRAFAKKSVIFLWSDFLSRFPIRVQLPRRLCYNIRQNTGSKNSFRG